MHFTLNVQTTSKKSGINTHNHMNATLQSHATLPYYNNKTAASNVTDWTFCILQQRAGIAAAQPQHATVYAYTTDNFIMITAPQPPSLNGQSRQRSNNNPHQHCHCYNKSGGESLGQHYFLTKMLVSLMINNPLATICGQTILMVL